MSGQEWGDNRDPRSLHLFQDPGPLSGPRELGERRVGEGDGEGSFGLPLGFGLGGQDHGPGQGAQAQELRETSSGP